MSTSNAVIVGSTYTELVDYLAPRPVRAKRQLRDMVAVIDYLMSKPKLTRDEEDYLELMAALVEEYESRQYPTPKVPQNQMLAHLMESREITQSELAQESGVAPSTISDVLAGHRQLSTTSINRLARYFGIEQGVLMFDTDDHVE